jgi:3-dehydrosphinganine reductase
VAKSRWYRQRLLKDKTAVLVGASKGIGKETAKTLVSLGCSVCIIARHPETLESAAAEIRSLIRHQEQFVDTIQCDATDMEQIHPCLTEFVGRRGVPDYLVNLVGRANPRYVQETSLADYRDSIEANYFGQLIPTMVLLPALIEARRGHIAFVSSMLGFMGIMGYAAYTPTKHALVGLAEVLRQELIPYGIQISILFPPDTDTPGFEVENKSKPEETALLSSNVKLMTAQDVAEAFVDGLLRRRYFILPGEAGLVWRVNRLFPWLVRWIADRQFRQARASLGKD